MTKWEYRVISLSTEKAHDLRLLNDLGQDGWELAAIGGTYGHVAYLKRPVKE